MVLARPSLPLLPEGLSVQIQNLKHTSGLASRFALTRTCVQLEGSYWKDEIKLTRSQSSAERTLHEQVRDPDNSQVREHIL